MDNRRGSILAICIIFIFIFTLLGMFAMRLVVLQNEVSDAELYTTRAHFAALYGSEIALWRIMQWENIATGNTYSGSEPGMRKFLPKDSRCFNYDGKAWYPLKDYNLNEDDFQDDITGGKGGIEILSSVYIDENPNPSDGFLPDMSEDSYDQKYGTYKFYVIETVATMYADFANRGDKITDATDKLYFIIAYSSGTAGAITLNGLKAITYNGVSYPEEIGLCFNKPDYAYIANYSASYYQWTPWYNATTDDYKNTHVEYFKKKYPELKGRALYEKIVDVTKHYTSAPNRSIVTGQIQPVFRYFIRGRR